MPKPAARLGALKPSPIRVLSEGAPADAVPLGLGEPTWELPEPARLALAGEKGVCAYGPNAGLPLLRSTLAAFYGARTEEVLVTCGSEEGLFAVAQAYLDPGDQVLVPDPGFPAYAAVARLASAEPVPYALDASAGFALDPERFAAALDAAPRAKLAVLNHPGNPTGGGASAAAMARIADLCEARDVLLLSDEVYRELHFGTRPASLREVTGRGLVSSSVSKGWGAPGLRVGWLLGADDLLAPIRTVHAFAVTATSAPSQRAAEALITASDEVLPAARREVQARFDALKDAWQEAFGEVLKPPAGAFYHWMPLPKAALADPMAFCLRVRDEARVVVVPGLAFGEGGRGYARLSFAARPDQIREGVRRLAPLWSAR
ncbi:MAG TPA: pyridoxal phosphate-dependent aminotransferase [Holophagaceae bacterium]|nr:pyridoxal phosphate-dependent aminotransferase [Holophagaceae bacterium]